jgi:hypothetical protein
MESKKIILFPELLEVCSLNFSCSLNYDKFIKELNKILKNKLNFSEAKSILNCLFEDVNDSQIIVLFGIILLVFGSSTKSENLVSPSSFLTSVC